MKTDVFEQTHFTQEGASFTDYEMFIPNEIGANQISVFKITKITQKQFDDAESQKSLAQVEAAASQIAILGMSPSGDILFKYSNPAQ